MSFMRFVMGALLGALLAASCVRADAGFFEQYEPAVVRVSSPDGMTGTGVRVYAPSGRIVILTNRHVCAHHIDGAMQVWRAGERAEIVPILDASRTTDICVLGGGHTKAALRVAPTYDFNQHVTAIGYPYGQLTVTGGHLVAREIFHDAYNDVFCHTYPKRGCKLQLYVVETDAEAHPGSSGSPLISDDGEVVALVYAVSTLPDAPMTFAIQLESLVSFLAKY